MREDTLTTIRDLARIIYRERKIPEEVPELAGHSIFSRDPILLDAQLISNSIPDGHPAITNAEKALFSETEFSVFRDSNSEVDPMIIHPGGGSRVSPTDIVPALLSGAFLHMYFLHLSNTEETYVALLLELVDELRRALNGHPMKTYSISAFTGFHLPWGQHVRWTTPWGILWQAFPIYSKRESWSFLHTSCFLVEPKRVPVKFDRSRVPENPFQGSDPESYQSQVLFRLACALASYDPSMPAIPTATWSITILPVRKGFIYSFSLQPPAFLVKSTGGLDVESFEEWARIVGDCHCPTVDISARRLVSAVAHRFDPIDALVDAVMVWENLLGTADEVTFRVTAAIAKALERDFPKRKALRTELGKIYRSRSAIVHGDSVKLDTVYRHAARAIDIAIMLLRNFYRRGPEWLAQKSGDRNERLLIEEP